MNSIQYFIIYIARQYARKLYKKKDWHCTPKIYVNTESNSLFYAQELSIPEREYCKKENLEIEKCRKSGSDEELLKVAFQSSFDTLDKHPTVH